MKIYNVAKAKARLSSLLKEVAAGQEIIITDHNRPVAKIVSVSKIPPLPLGDVVKILEWKPIPLKKGALSSSQLIRKLRDEE